MKWMLVVIAILDGHGPEVMMEGIYDSMNQCFDARDVQIWNLFEDPEGRPPINYQLVCIPTDKY